MEKYFNYYRGKTFNWTSENVRKFIFIVFPTTFSLFLLLFWCSGVLVFWCLLWIVDCISEFFQQIASSFCNTRRLCPLRPSILLECQDYYSFYRKFFQILILGLRKFSPKRKCRKYVASSSFCIVIQTFWSMVQEAKKKKLCKCPKDFSQFLRVFRTWFLFFTYFVAFWKNSLPKNKVFHLILPQKRQIST